MRPKIVDPLGSRATRRIVTAEGDTRTVVPTVDTYVRQRVRKAKKKVVVRMKGRSW